MISALALARDSGSIKLLMLVDHCDFNWGPVFNQASKYTYRGSLGRKVRHFCVFHTKTSAWPFTNTELLTLTGGMYLLVPKGTELQQDYWF